jgi:hypothetical protein
MERPGDGLNDQEVADFVDRFMPAYKLYLPTLYSSGPQKTVSKVFIFCFFIFGLFCYICIFYYLYVDSLPYAFIWSPFMCRIRFCDTLVVIFFK